MSIDSTNLQPEDWLVMVKAIMKNYDGYDGFVLTHGTDTMAYTAAALSYLVQNSCKPIVITGSQFPMEHPQSDASKNLLDSFRFAADGTACGVFLVFCGRVIVGTRARKIKSHSLDAFESVNLPQAAHIDDGQITLNGNFAQDKGKLRFYDQIHTGVMLFKLFPGLQPAILEHAAKHYDAIIIESYGVGGMPFEQPRDFLQTITTMTQQGKFVVLGTQVMYEGTKLETYEVGMKILQEGCILQTHDMTIEASLVKMMWILGMTQIPDMVKKHFYTPIHSDLSR